MEFLTLEDIVEINKKVGEGGTLVRKGDLEFVLDKVSMSKDVMKAATNLLYDMIHAHAFLNGNKRTAFQAMRAFLVLNGKTLTHNESNEKTIERLLYDIAQSKISKSKVEKILKKMIK